MFMGKPEGKKRLGRIRHKWMVSIKMNLGEIGRGGMDWIDLAEYRDQWKALVNRTVSLRVLFNAGKFLSSCKTGGNNGSPPWS
jgi:hypothetical protein